MEGFFLLQVKSLVRTLDELIVSKVLSFIFSCQCLEGSEMESPEGYHHLWNLSQKDLMLFVLLVENQYVQINTSLAAREKSFLCPRLFHLP
jgi:two-component SAPR family response regulator